MRSPLSGILQAVNRDKKSKLKILSCNNHEAYFSTLARTGHLFYVLQNPRAHPWDEREHPRPDNIIFLSQQDVQQQLKSDLTFDLIISQNELDHYPILSQLANQMNIPLISLSHTLPWITWNQETIEQVGNQKSDLYVYVAEYCAEAWFKNKDDQNVKIITHGMDHNFWNGWRGGNGKIFTAVWDFKRRSQICGYDLFMEVTKGLPVEIAGDTPGLSKPAKNRDSLREMYRSANVYLNTTLYSSLPFSLIEAMSVGLPVVSTATTSIPEFIEDGVNGFCTNDHHRMRECLELLLKDQKLAKEIGERGRQTVIEKFGLDRFVNEWNDVFNEVAGKQSIMNY